MTQGRQPSTRTTDEIIDLRRQLLTLQEDLRTAHFRRRAFFFSPAVAVTLIAVTWVIFSLHFPTSVRNLGYILIPCTLASVIYMAYYITTHYATHEAETVRSIELELTLASERKALESARLSVDPSIRRSAYRDKVEQDVVVLRKESSHYRRVHNLFQNIIIIGSLLTTTLAGLTTQDVRVRWAVLCTSFTVGIAAGVTGYFKFRERGFYLQETADNLELEWNAVELGIGRYKDMSSDIALSAFVEEAERLRSEQRKREQSLDQAPETTVDNALT